MPDPRFIDPEVPDYAEIDAIERAEIHDALFQFAIEHKLDIDTGEGWPEEMEQAWGARVGEIEAFWNAEREKVRAALDHMVDMDLSALEADTTGER